MLLVLAAVFIGGLLLLFFLVKEPKAKTKGRGAKGRSGRGSGGSGSRSSASRAGNGRAFWDRTETGNGISVHVTADPEQVFELIAMRLGHVSKAPSDVPTLYVRYFGERAMRIIYASTDEEVFSYRVDCVAERVGVYEYRASMHVVNQQGFGRAQPVARKVQEAVGTTLRSFQQVRR